MKRFLVYLLSIVLVLVCGAIVVGDDYFSRITMASDGRITRFSHTSVSVYIATPNVPRSLQQLYIADAQYALDQWSGCSEEQLQFKLVDSEDNTDIRIYWVEGLLGGEADSLGEASLVRSDSGEFYVKISILLKGIPSSADSVHKELRSVFLHELGHAVGLWGHSHDPNDVMYLRSKAIYPTRRDKDTLLKLLSYPHGSPFHENAIAELRSDISSINPSSAYLYFWLGSVYADNDKDDLAIQELTTALKLDPNLLRVADRLGRIFQKEGMNRKAVAYYLREAELDPSPGLFGMIGMLYLQQKDYATAVDYFQKAFYLDNQFLAGKTNALAAYHLWASELIKDGGVRTAISVLSRALELFPSYRVLYYDLGTAYDADRQYEKAIEHYKKALEIDPSFVVAKRDIATCLNNLGVEHMRNKNWENSIELCKQALEWDPNCWEARKNLESTTLGLAREKHDAGLLDEAILYYNAVLEMNPNNLDAHSNLGNIFYNKGMHKDALRQFRTALDIDPNFYDAKAGLTMVKRHINAGRAKMSVLLIISSLTLCVIIIVSYRYLRRGKVSTDRKVQPE